VVLALVATALAVAAAHLVAVAIWAPHAFAHWRYIYLGRSLVERVSGEGYADYWRQPPGMYWSLATRALGLVLPFVAIGAENAWRRRAEPVPRALLVWSAGLLLLSLFRIKSGGYAYVVMPAWAALAAIGIDAIARGVRPSPWPLVAGVLLTSPLVSPWGAQGLPVPAWAAVWAAALALAVPDREARRGMGAPRARARHRAERGAALGAVSHAGLRAGRRRDRAAAFAHPARSGVLRRARGAHVRLPPLPHRALLGHALRSLERGASA
jgi:hypothetical protein